MSRLKPKIGPIGVALTVWDVYRRLPPRQRKMVLDLARTHGPKLASRAMQAQRNVRRNRKP
jgi:hypothetical protein